MKSNLPLDLGNDLRRNARLFWFGLPGLAHAPTVVCQVDVSSSVLSIVDDAQVVSAPNDGLKAEAPALLHRKQSCPIKVLPGRPRELPPKRCAWRKHCACETIGFVLRLI